MNSYIASNMFPVVSINRLPAYVRILVLMLVPLESVIFLTSPLHMLLNSS
jgi:hypothetical protein